MRMGDSFSRWTITPESATVLADSKGRSAASILIGGAAAAAGDDDRLTVLRSNASITFISAG